MKISEYNQDFNLKVLKDNLTAQEIQLADFGVEREGLRVTEEGGLALTKHPAPFGNKLLNPLITTDFSESQVEMITPIRHSVEDVYDVLELLYDLTATSLAEDEYLWPQSMPSRIPGDDAIPIAIYEGEANAESAMAYRQGLVKKYGAKKQLISGIHYNFSFAEKNIETLFKASSRYPDYQTYKNAVYLKLVRNYLRYKWLVIYLTGCSAGCHDSYIPYCVEQMAPVDDQGGRVLKKGVSFRNSHCGYKNTVPLYPDYRTVDHFVKDVQGYVDSGILSAPKELYTQIRLKSKDAGDVLGSLSRDGIQYVEVRTLDLNIFDKCGIAKDDLNFMHALMLYLLVKEESDYGDWQAEGVLNEEVTAVQALDPDLILFRDGAPVSMKTWALAILTEMEGMNRELSLDFAPTLAEMKGRVTDPARTYGARMARLIEEKGFLKGQVPLAEYYKQDSIRHLAALKESGRWDGLSDFVDEALPGCRR